MDPIWAEEAPVFTLNGRHKPPMPTTLHLNSSKAVDSFPFFVAWRSRGPWESWQDVHPDQHHIRKGLTEVGYHPPDVPEAPAQANGTHIISSPVKENGLGRAAQSYLRFHGLLDGGPGGALLCEEGDLQLSCRLACPVRNRIPNHPYVVMYHVTGGCRTTFESSTPAWGISSL